jgi:hypothetical protein
LALALGLWFFVVIYNILNAAGVKGCFPEGWTLSGIFSGGFQVAVFVALVRFVLVVYLVSLITVRGRFSLSRGLLGLVWGFETGSRDIIRVAAFCILRVHFLLFSLSLLATVRGGTSFLCQTATKKRSKENAFPTANS